MRQTSIMDSKTKANKTSHQTDALLERIQAASQSGARALALLRIELLQNVDTAEKNTCATATGGLANELVSMLLDSLDASDEETAARVLTLMKELVTTDVTLTEEVVCSKGFRAGLEDLQKNECKEEENGEEVDDDDDDLDSLQSLAAEVQDSLSELETVDRPEPFTRTELESRLPLIFGIPQEDNEQDNLQIMVHQVTSEEETDTHDTGFVMWPSSVMLARHIAENPSLILPTKCKYDDESISNGYNGDILELGAGCGLVGLTAAVLRKQEKEAREEGGGTNQEEKKSEENDGDVIFTDYCETVRDNIERNLDLNDLSDCQVAGLDFFDQPGNDDSKFDDDQPNWIDTEGNPRPQVGLILAADVIYYSNDAINVANTINAALVDGGKAIVVSAGDNRRFGVEDFPGACADAGLEVKMTHISADNSSSCVGANGDDNDDENGQDKELLMNDLAQTSMQNYQPEDYNLIMFTIDKPSS